MAWKIINYLYKPFARLPDKVLFKWQTGPMTTHDKTTIRIAIPHMAHKTQTWQCKQKTENQTCTEHIFIVYTNTNGSSTSSDNLFNPLQSNKVYGYTTIFNNSLKRRFLAWLYDGHEKKKMIRDFYLTTGAYRGTYVFEIYRYIVYSCVVI